MSSPADHHSVVIVKIMAGKLGFDYRLVRTNIWGGFNRATNSWTGSIGKVIQPATLSRFSVSIDKLILSSPSLPFLLREHASHSWL